MEHQGFRYPVAETRRKDSANATLDTIEFDPVRAKRMQVIERIAVENETTAFTDFRVYIAGLGEKLYLLEQDAPAADTLYWDDQPIYIPEGRWLAVDFYGTTLADDLAVHINGFEVLQPEGR
jgi:hypothetical protein